MRFDFGDITFCGPAATGAEAAKASCVRAGFECGPPPCAIAPDDDECTPAPTDGGVEPIFEPCDAGPIDFCREHMPESGAGCCGESVSPLCRIGGSGFGCPEGSIPTSECTSCS